MFQSHQVAHWGTYVTKHGERNFTSALIRTWKSKYMPHVGKKQLSKKAKA